MQHDERHQLSETGLLLKFLLLRLSVGQCPGLISEILPPEERAIWKDSNPLGEFWPHSVIRVLKELGTPVSAEVEAVITGSSGLPEYHFGDLPADGSPRSISHKSSPDENAVDQGINVGGGQSVFVDERSEEETSDRGVLKPSEDVFADSGNFNGVEGHNGI